MVTTNEWYGFHIQTGVSRRGIRLGFVTFEQPFEQYSASVSLDSHRAHSRHAVYADAVAWVVAQYDAEIARLAQLATVEAANAAASAVAAEAVQS